jgi:hypothetical protein
LLSHGGTRRLHTPPKLVNTLEGKSGEITKRFLPNSVDVFDCDKGEDVLNADILIFPELLPEGFIVLFDNLS